VKYLKLAVVICGALGLAGMVMMGLGPMLDSRKASTLVMLIAFALPVLMGVTGLARPPFQAWQAGVALACFALAVIKLRIWTLMEAIADGPMGLKLLAAGACLGVIASAIAVLRPEATA
jgi:hypothetical protein